MNSARKWLRTIGLVAAAFAGGAVTSHFAGATTQAASPYAPFEQLGRVLALVENQYVEPAQRSRIIEGAIKGMVAELDPHSAYMNAEEFAVFQSDTEGKFGGIGVEVEYRNEYVTVIAPIEESPAERAGVRPGDQVLAINGRVLHGEPIDKLVAIMRGLPGTKVKVTLRRTGVTDPFTLELQRELIHVKSVIGKRLAKDVAYVRLRQFQEGTHTELLKVISALRAESKAPLSGAVLDLRNNPGGLVDEAEAVADEMLSSGVIYSTRHRGQVVDEVTARPGGALASIPIVVLVNEYSASAAELLAGALQDTRHAPVVGATTFGKGSVQTIYDLPGGAGIRLTTMRYYTPSGRSIQAAGIRPDVVLEAPRSADAQLGPEIVRESDLDGHLPAEGAQVAPGAGAPSAGAAPGSAPQAGGGEITRDVRDIPADPSQGKDQGLAFAFKQLMRSIAEKR